MGAILISVGSALNLGAFGTAIDARYKSCPTCTFLQHEEGWVALGMGVVSAGMIAGGIVSYILGGKRMERLWRPSVLFTPSGGAVTLSYAF